MAGVRGDFLAAVGAEVFVTGENHFAIVGFAQCTQSRRPSPRRCGSCSAKHSVAIFSVFRVTGAPYGLSTLRALRILPGTLFPLLVLRPDQRSLLSVSAPGAASGIRCFSVGGISTKPPHPFGCPLPVILTNTC